MNFITIKTKNILLVAKLLNIKEYNKYGTFSQVIVKSLEDNNAQGYCIHFRINMFDKAIQLIKGILKDCYSIEMDSFFTSNAIIFRYSYYPEFKDKPNIVVCWKGSDFAEDSLIGEYESIDDAIEVMKEKLFKKKQIY